MTWASLFALLAQAPAAPPPLANPAALGLPVNQALPIAPGFIAAWLALGVGLVGFGTWFQSRFPAASDEMVRLYITKGRRCLLVGITDAIVATLLITVLCKVRVLAPLGLCFAILTGLLLLAGRSVAYRVAGLRVNPAWTANPPAMPTFVGGAVLESATFLPVFGQLLLTVVTLRGFGAAILTVMASWRAVRKSVAERNQPKPNENSPMQPAPESSSGTPTHEA